MNIDIPQEHLARENRAGIARVTCGWKKQHLSLELVRRYWRDVHSPGISRRPGLWEYRHLQYDPVRTDVIGAVEGIDQECPADQQLMWTSDVRYLDQAGVALFNSEPSPDVKTQLLGDIELIVDQSTTYLVVGDNARTWVDATGTAEPQGPSAHPTFAVFFRQRGSESAFRAGMRQLAARWAATSGVLRVRLALFEVPDMDAERRAGYPIKTHPVERQYQAWIDLSVANTADAQDLLTAEDALFMHTVHVYPVPVVYTSVSGGALTIVGLRGWPAFDAMQGLNAVNQRDPALLQWMYGGVASRSPA